MGIIDNAVVLAEGKYLRLVRRGHWEYAERNSARAAVMILAITDGRIVLTEQFRIPHQKRVIELPAGLVGDEHGDADDIRTAARRELLEETGYEAREMTWLTEGPTSAGLSSEIVTLVRASGLRKVGRGGGVGSEAIQVHEVPLAQAHDWLQARIEAGVPVDPKVFAALYFAARTSAA